MDVGLQRLRDQATLLELFVVGLETPKQVPFDRVYALGFDAPEPLYKLGHAMTKAVVNDLGLAALGTNTLNALALLSTQCHRAAS